MDDLEAIARLEYGKAAEQIAREMQEELRMALTGKPAGGLREHAKLQVYLNATEKSCRAYAHIWQGLFEARSGGYLKRDNVDFVVHEVMQMVASKKRGLAKDFPSHVVGVDSEVGRRMDSIELRFGVTSK